MGKSNKFDYSNRGSVGKRLGEIIGTALQKESDKVKKDAERHAQKARKQTADTGVNGTDSLVTTHLVDLKAPGKELGDDGVCALADGLEIALSSGTSSASLALEDLNLANNGITVVSLARLATIIELAKFDLKTLNLSDNAIRVETDEEAARWEVFLQSFSSCHKLRRLDLSGNSQLGPKALEIFARVHCNEPPIDHGEFGGSRSVLSLVSENDHEGDNDVQAEEQVAENTVENGGSGAHMLARQLIRRRCGLRAIPYITLNNIGLNDAGALWLSFILEDHLYPVQLMDGLNAASLESTIKAYQQNSNSDGLDWTKDSALGKDGMLLLETTEVYRRRSLFDVKGSNASSAAFDFIDSPADNSSQRRSSTERSEHRSFPGYRRGSVRSIHTADGGEHEATEIESTRKKIQRHVISNDGAGSVELWAAALKLFITSRKLLYITPPKFAPCVSDSKHAVDPAPPHRPDSPNEETECFIVASAPVPIPRTPQRTLSYASALTARRGSEQALTEVTNTPTSPLIYQNPAHRKNAFSVPNASETITDKLNALIFNETTPRSSNRFVKYQQGLLPNAGHLLLENGCESTTSSLPSLIVERIVAEVLTSREIAVMSETQRRGVIACGQDRSTFASEREWLKMGLSAQVWMLLDRLGCLAYCSD